MNAHEKIRDRERKRFDFVRLILVTVVIMGVSGVNKGMAQVSPNAVSYAFTGNAIPYGGNNGGVSGSNISLLRTPGLRAGPFQVYPFLGVAEIYSDNVFRSQSNRQYDFVHAVSPGMQVQLPFAGLHQAVVDYRATQLYSQRFSANNVMRQDLTGQILMNFPGGLNINLSGGYTKGFDLRGSAVDVQALEPTRWNTKTFNGQIETLGSQFGVRVQVQTIDWKYENNNQAPFRDRLSSQGNMTVYGSIAPKTFALLNVGVGRVNYDQNIQLDNTSYNFSTGLRWNATGKTTGEIQVGYTFLTYDRAPVSQATLSTGGTTILSTGGTTTLSTGGSGNQIVYVNGNLNWQPTPRSNISMRPYRTIQQSGVFGTSFYTQTGVKFYGSFSIGIRTTLNGNFQYSHNAYNNDQGTSTLPNRTDNRMGGGLGVSYQAVQWLGLRAQYQYDQRNSTIDHFEYFANTLMVSIQGAF